MNDLSLRISVMTSSSWRPLASLFAETCAVSGVDHYDLMYLRDTDRDAISLVYELDKAKRPERMADFLADETWRQRAHDWAVEQAEAARAANPAFQLAALATYFPDVTSRDTTRRDAAKGALVSASLAALDLAQRGLMAHPIVEVVAGTILDPCPCPRCRHVEAKEEENGQQEVLEQNPFVFEFGRNHKLQLLCDSLKEVLARVASHRARSAAWGDAAPSFSVELEPGSAYALNDQASLRDLLRLADLAGIGDRVGLNLDLAHWLIARVDPAFLDEPAVLRRVLHAHIADHPGHPDARMHTRDHPIGAFSSVEQIGQGEYYGFLDRLIARARQAKADMSPFAGAIAIELEGNNKMAWLHRSVAQLRHALHAAERRFGR